MSRRQGVFTIATRLIECGKYQGCCDAIINSPEGCYGDILFFKRYFRPYEYTHENEYWWALGETGKLPRLIALDLAALIADEED